MASKTTPGVEVEVVVGFATKEAVILEEELSQVAHVTVTTDDGTMLGLG